MAVAIQARQRVREVRDLFRFDRGAALTELEDIFEEADYPYPLLDGRYSGQIVATTLGQITDSAARLLMNVWMPWKGKSFDIETCTGANILTRGGARLGRGLFPTYRGMTRDSGERYLGFQFSLSYGASRINSDQDVLRIDYDLPHNPGPVRKMLDELVEIGEGYYLGRSLLRRAVNKVQCLHYFTLSEVFDPGMGLELFNI
jgi:hypothetical protein